MRCESNGRNPHRDCGLQKELCRFHQLPTKSGKILRSWDQPPTLPTEKVAEETQGKGRVDHSAISAVLED
jgi:hypothetical protein